MRKRYAVVGIGLLLIAMVVSSACGDDDTPTPVPSTPTVPVNTPVSVLPTPQVGGSLTIYSGREEKLIEPIIEQFEQATDIDVNVKYGSNAGLVITIQEEGKNSPADIFFGSDPGALGALQDRLTVLHDDILNKVPSQLRSREGKWVAYPVVLESSFTTLTC